jgi:hypothetical protein
MFRRVAPVSLTDTAYEHHVDLWAIFRDIDPSRAILRRWLKPGFGHCEIWQYVPPGAWLRFDTAADIVMPEVYAHPPWELIPSESNLTCLHVAHTVHHGQIRERFFIGPLSCVQMAAAFLGVRLPFWCRTPYKLYKLLSEEKQ